MKKAAAIKKKKGLLAAPSKSTVATPDYSGLLGGVGELLEAARHRTIRQTQSGISETLSRKSVLMKIWQTLSAKSAALKIRSTPSNIFQAASGISPQLGKRSADEPNAPSLARRAQRPIHHLVTRIGPNASSSPLALIAGRVLSPA